MRQRHTAATVTSDATADNDFWVAGIDGCPAGWVACYRHLASGAMQFRVAAAIARLLAAPQPVACFAVDMPIGLPAAAEPGGRACERAARALLGRRSSCVFATPCRGALAAPSYAEALQRNRASSAASLGLSRQAWNIVPRIGQLDALLRADPALGQRVHEAHPELAFARMNRDRPLAAGKRTAQGRTQRQRLLARHGLGAAIGAAALYPRHAVAIDDLLDAAALARTAELIVRRQHRRLPADPPRDQHGIVMAITW